MFPEFDEEMAWKLGSRLRDLALARRLPVVIEIKRFGLPLFYSALDGSTPDNAEWVRRKGNIVARFHRSSYAIGLELKQANSTLAEKLRALLSRLRLARRIVSFESGRSRGDRFRNGVRAAAAGRP